MEEAVPEEVGVLVCVTLGRVIVPESVVEVEEEVGTVSVEFKVAVEEAPAESVVTKVVESVEEKFAGKVLEMY